ncbi:NACHT domain-containing protein [Streptomyces sp. NPDC051016]|uniref:NACHT domain-containing protein n=1 Tax=Streptomyces sp. NPDC051016 TaxID=3365638 RepID=UPI00379A9E53
MDYDLTRLGSREFEHLTQALAIQILGPGVQAFGDGPDGGREAEFRGQLNYPQPSPHGPWNGYGVLQAKFLQRPRDTARDTAWLLGQLRTELRQWANPKSKRSRVGAVPDYLLFATNVVLSADPKVGGIDLFERTAKDLVAELQLPVKDVKVWHFDQICRYLDLHPGVRQTYGGLTTAGDILFRLRDFLEGTAAELGELLANHSSKELATDQWVKLGQAGEADNQRLPLAELAIDPAASYASPDGSQEAVSLVRHVLAHGDTVLRPSCRENNSPAHIAVFGGPGQGKSTVGQILCQVYRSALLRDAASQLAAETADIITTFTDEMERIGLEVPAARRWPIRINLSEYADAVAGGEVVSILRYMATEISRRTPDVSPNQLRAWLRAWPWLVVLDGLDEVASAQGRDTVMDRVNDFLLEAASVDADLLIVATSRPQGYRGEFSSRHFVHMRLEPMAADEAVSYATQLTRIRHYGDPDTAERVLQRLEEAAQEELTSRLMGTPLQVTIMAILLERRERVPQQRYRLFLDYYQTIYNREASKPGALAKLIDDHRAAINHLHERVGLFLQAISERRGESDAALHRSDVSRILEVYLHDEGYSYADAAALSERIVDAAMRRLIFLVPHKEESVGFDVRSLQEFMAARAIVSEDLSETCEFLVAISGSAHWRNTWLLAAGCIFNERPAARDRLVNLLDEVQVADELSLFVKPGSSLAVELIADDVAVKAPRFLRALTKQALELLEEPTEEFEASDLCEALWKVGGVDGPSRQAIERAIVKNVAAGGHGAVNTLTTLGVEWEGRSGPLAYQVRKLVLEAREKKEDLAAQLGSRHLWPSYLASAVNKDSTKLKMRSFWEVVHPYVESSGDRIARDACYAIFKGDSVGFMQTPDGRDVAVTFRPKGGKRTYNLKPDAGWIECLISVAEAVPIELWMIRYQIRRILQTYQERNPVDFSVLASISIFDDLVHFLKHPNELYLETDF